MLNNLRKGVVVVATIALLVLGLTLSATAQGPDPAASISAGQITVSGPVTGVSFSPAAQAAAMAYWSKDRIVAAAPQVVASQSAGNTAPVIDETAEAAALGTPGSTPPGAPAADADRQARRDYPREWAAIDAAVRAEIRNGQAWMANEASPAAVEGNSGVFTSYVINQQAAVQRNFPHRVAGKLTFNTPQGASSCSASVISGNNVIVTAAHCIYDTPTRNQFYTNIVFTPAFRDGNAPYGTFPAQNCWVLTSWINLSGGYAINTWADDDVAVCKMGNNSAGKSLSSQAGWFGRAWDNGYVQHFHTLGYPVNSTANTALPNAGKFLRSCQSESFQQAANVVGTGCNLGPGHSGGAFIIGYQLNAVAGQVRSVYSGYFTNTNNAYGARFTSNNIVPLCNAAGC
ncbi:MAG: trypsin-like serine protease [Candidatus Promineofilum sp.]|nr:trypsin-like serine protease [Promineifilum sp.]